MQGKQIYLLINKKNGFAVLHKQNFKKYLAEFPEFNLKEVLQAKKRINAL
jgi:hypothetical protein